MHVFYSRGMMKLPKIENDDHVLISSRHANRISYQSDEKLQFQVNVNRLLNVKSYIQDVIEKERLPTLQMYPQRKQNKATTATATTATNSSRRQQPNKYSASPFNNKTKLPSIPPNSWTQWRNNPNMTWYFLVKCSSRMYRHSSNLVRPLKVTNVRFFFL